MSTNTPAINVQVTFRHIESTSALMAYATEKVKHCCEKYVHEDTNVHVILAVEKRDHEAEVVLHSKNFDVRVQSNAADLYAAIDLVCDTLSTQLRKQKERMVDHKRTPDSKASGAQF